MDLAGLHELFLALDEDVSAGDGAWRFEVGEVRLACLTDSRFDRMRLIAPIAETDDISDTQRDAILEANFHTALDGRYATSDGVLYAAFIHPLSTLTADELRSAVGQVVSLVQTFGSEYTGGTLAFGLGPDGGQLN